MLGVGGGATVAVGWGVPAGDSPRPTWQRATDSHGSAGQLSPPTSLSTGLCTENRRTRHPRCRRRAANTRRRHHECTEPTKHLGGAPGIRLAGQRGVRGPSQRVYTPWHGQLARYGQHGGDQLNEHKSKRRTPDGGLLALLAQNTSTFRRASPRRHECAYRNLTREHGH